MPQKAASTARAAMRDLQLTLARAADAQIVEVVSLVDAMAERGAADALLQPLRPRLQQIRPQRRLGLTRLLFLPIDPVIVAAPQWRRTAPTIPRSALACIARQIRDRLGPLADTLEAELAGAVSDDTHRLMRCGRQLWPAAADILRGAPIPPDWQEATGLAETDHAAIVFPLAVVMRRAVTIDQLAIMAACGMEGLSSAIEVCLKTAIADMGESAAQPTGAASRMLGILLAILLARLPSAEPVIIAASDLAAHLSNPALRVAADLAIEFLLDLAEATSESRGDLVTAAGELSRMATLFDSLDRPGPTQRPRCKTRVAQLRHSTDMACRLRFESESTTRLLQRADTLGAGATDEAVGALEAAALDLRRFEAAGRRFGGDAVYDQMLRQTTSSLIGAAPADTAPIDLARIVEILQGPEAALEMLAAGVAAEAAVR